MKNSRNLVILIVCSIALAALVAVQVGCGKKDAGKAHAPARVVCLIGSTAIQRGGAAPAGLALGDVIGEGDTLITGDRSFIVIQVGDRGIVKVQENSTVETRKFFSGNEAQLFLRRGGVASKLAKLGKGASYSIVTATMTASVRGTIFTVVAREGNEIVAVGEGSVLVEVNPGITVKPVKKTNINAGVAAVVSSRDAGAGYRDVTITTRPIDSDESLKSKKMSRIGIAPAIDTVTAEDLSKMQREILRIESELNAKAGDVGNVDASNKTEKIKRLINQHSRTMEQIRETFERIDEVSLYSGRIIRGAIISRGDVYSVLTPGGVVSVPKGDVQAVKVVK